MVEFNQVCLNSMRHKVRLLLQFIAYAARYAGVKGTSHVTKKISFLVV